MEHATYRSDGPAETFARLLAARKQYPGAKSFKFRCDTRTGRWACTPIYGSIKKHDVKVQQENLKRRLQLIEKF